MSVAGRRLPAGLAQAGWTCSRCSRRHRSW